MAEALVSVLLDQLASFIRTQIKQEVDLIIGVKEELENLTLHLEAVQAVLQNAEERQVKEPDVRNWLENLKDVSYGINNVLDEWTTEILKRQIEKQEKGKSAIVAQNKVCFFLPSLCLSFGRVGQISVRRDIAKRIKELNKRLTLIANLRRDYSFQRQIRATEQLERPKTTSFVDMSTIIGRENEKDILIRKLLSESSQEVRSPLVIIPIVGMGGIGKTALAQLVYHDEKVKAHFDKRIWVCVSDPFEEIKIARAILEELNNNDTRIDSNELQTLLQCIYECIKGEKLILILDDVWNPSRTKWEQLKAALQNCAVGSRIVVTTRKEDVPIMLGATTDHLLHLKELSQKICLSIFFDIVFFNNKRDDFKMFEDIGSEIVKKCKGLPLAAKTLGSLMRYKKTKKEWQAVLDSKIWEFKEVEQEVFQPLLLSYYDLTPEIKRCLLYCAVFPKDHVFNIDVLIEMWMSQDYLNLEQNKETQIMIGQNYFENLAMRSFFQDFYKDNEDNIIECKMHDIVHDFVQLLTKNECFIMEVYSDDERNRLLNSKVRHLRLMFAPNDSFQGYNCEKMLTLEACKLKISTWNSNLIVKLKYLRTLNLSHNSIKEFPSEIDRQIHLRYLDLSFNWDLIKLPDTMGNLYNLQTLRLTDCCGLEELPKTVRKLINLKHLYVGGCIRLNLPKEIGELTRLQRLDMVPVHEYEGYNNEGGFKLGNLKNMDQLQGSLKLSELRRMKDAREAREAQLVNKKHLLKLELDFGFGFAGNEEGKVADEDQGILNALQPHTNLENLIIRSYRSTTLNLDWWMSMHNLTRLTLCSADFFKYLPPLGKLPSLEILKIIWMDSVQKVGGEFLGIDELQRQTPTQYSFPKLKRLEFTGLNSWEAWEGVGGWVDTEKCEITIMPSLSSLEIKDCMNLKTLPDFLWKSPLQKLTIGECPLLTEHCKNIGRGSGGEWAKMSQIPNVDINSRFVQKDGVLMDEQERQ